jgi:hypothetical protein
MSGPTAEVVPRYLAQSATERFFQRSGDTGKPIFIREAGVAVLDQDNASVLEVSAVVESALSTLVSLDIRLADVYGVAVGFGSAGSLSPNELIALTPGTNRVTARFRIGFLASGSYLVGLDLTYPEAAYLDRIENCLRFDFHGTPRRPNTRRPSQNWGCGCWEIPLAGSTVTSQTS